MKLRWECSSVVLGFELGIASTFLSILYGVAPRNCPQHSEHKLQSQPGDSQGSPTLLTDPTALDLTAMLSLCTHL